LWIDTFSEVARRFNGRVCPMAAQSLDPKMFGFSLGGSMSNESGSSDFFSGD
jgi:hypothetical protein